jgi:hypothetical protein
MILMKSVRCAAALALALSVLAATPAAASNPAKQRQPLFPSDGVPSGWLVTDWADLSKPGPEGAQWRATNGVLHGSTPRGTWFMSEREYGDFVLEFEWRLGDRGNSGLAFRSPLRGDPAFDGFELQMVDPRYYPPGEKVTAAELTGSLYRAVAPTVQAFKPNEWNRYRLTARGRHISVLLNGQSILEVDLDQQTEPTTRHDGTDAPPLRDRPTRGHIGFQELSRGGGQVEIRNATIRELR